MGKRRNSWGGEFYKNKVFSGRGIDKLCFFIASVAPGCIACRGALQRRALPSYLLPTTCYLLPLAYFYNRLIFFNSTNAVGLYKDIFITGVSLADFCSRLIFSGGFETLL